MNWQNFASVFVGLLPALVGLVAFIPYWIAIGKGKTRPSQASWWIWSALTIIATVGKIEAGADWQVVALPATISVAQVATAIWSLFKGDKDWGWLNSSCVILAIGAAILLWEYTSNPNLIIALGILGDALGFIPTLRHMRAKPQEENLLAWSLGWISSILELTVIRKWDFANVGWPVYYFIAMSITICLLWKGLRKQTHNLDRSLPKME